MKASHDFVDMRLTLIFSSHEAIKAAVNRILRYQVFKPTRSLWPEGWIWENTVGSVKCDSCAIKTEGLHIGLFVAFRVGTVAVKGSVNKWWRYLPPFTRAKFNFVYLSPVTVLRGQRTDLASALFSLLIHFRFPFLGSVSYFLLFSLHRFIFQFLQKMCTEGWGWLSEIWQ
jgi:hypothetical protein